MRALEVVATRGRDVISVRHLLDGGTCWVGPAQSSIANVSMREFGGQAAQLAEVVDGRCVVHVPPLARARTQDASGLWRLLVGPVDVAVAEGERAVVVLGSVQIRTRVIHIERAGSAKYPRQREALRWLLSMAALYFMVFGIFALVVPEKPRRLEHGALQRAVIATLERAAEKARARPMP
ncbi:MAG TPA: hypothetical protein PK156_32845 [Polyangium sp.]|nr:hypothetical protein [Polyangium sp.]